MFVKNVRHDEGMRAEQVINQSMGVRRPPKKAVKERSADVSVKGPLEGSVEKIKAGTEEDARIVHERQLSAHEKSIAKTKAKPAQPKGDDKIADTSIHDRTASKAEQEDDKLESIKITAPGTYELNLPSLFERDELIMAVKEGTYFIDLSSAFRKGKKE